MIALKITTGKIDKEKLYKGAKGTYLDVILMENKEGPDEYGNDGYAVQGIPKEARDRGEKGKIIGNWKRMANRSQERQKPATAQPELPAEAEDDDVPF